jgi:hypothetical protein
MKPWTKPTRRSVHERIRDSHRLHRLLDSGFFPSLWMNTMKRCTPNAHAVLRRQTLLAIGLMTLGLTAHAQALPRKFPDNALRGTMVVTQPPWITMDGKSAQLSPGARIKNVNNTLVMSGSLVGQEIVVNYALNGGLVHEVWILDQREAAQKRPRAADLQN